MAAAAKTSLRELLTWESLELERIAKATSERLDRVRRAKALLAISQGNTFTQAALAGGFKTGDGVMFLVKRFNQRGLGALSIASGRGPKPRYSSEVRSLVITTVQQTPDRLKDQTATWSLTTLQRHLRNKQAILAHIGATTIRRIIKEAGFSYQQTRSWCQTGQVKRVRKAGVVTVYDPKAEEKKE